MEIAAALLAGAAAFFAGFCLGCFPPAKPYTAKRPAMFSTSKDEFFEDFLNYDGEIKP